MAQREFIRDLAVRFGIVADTKGLDAFDKRVEAAKKHMGEAADSWRAAGGELRKLGEQFALAGAAGAAVVLGLGILTNETATYAVAVERQSAMLGMTTDAYQELRGVMERFGVDQRDVADLFAQIAQQSVAAQNGASNIELAFKNLGISLADIKGKDPEGLFLAIADGAARTGDATTRLSSLSTLLGEDLTKKLGPLLGKGADGIAQFRAELRATGVVLSTEAIAASAEYRASMSTLTTTVKALGQQIAIAFLPAVKQLADSMGAWIKRNREIIDQRIEQVVGSLSRAMAVAIRIGAVFVRNIRTIEIALAGAAAAGVALFGALAAFRTGSAAYHGIMGLVSAADGIKTLGMALQMLGSSAVGDAVMLSTGPLASLGIALEGITAGTLAIGLAGLAAGLALAAAEAAVFAAGVYTLYVAFEDTYTFLSGTGNSVTGDLVARFAEADTALGAWARTGLLWRDTLRAGVSIVSSLATMVGQSLQPVLDRLAPVLNTISAAIHAAFGGATAALVEQAFRPFYLFEALLMRLQPMVSSLASNLALAASTGQGLGGLIPGFGPGASGERITQGGATTNVTNSTSVGAVSVQTGSGDPQQIALATQAGISAAIRAERRQAAASATGGPR